MKFKVNNSTGISDSTRCKFEELEEFLKSLTDSEFQEINNFKTKIFRDEVSRRIGEIKARLKAIKTPA